MRHPIFRVQRFQIVGPFKLRVGFDDGTEQLIDFGPVLAGELFGPLSVTGIVRVPRRNRPAVRTRKASG